MGMGMAGCLSQATSKIESRSRSSEGVQMQSLIITPQKGHGIITTTTATTSTSIIRRHIM